MNASSSRLALLVSDRVPSATLVERLSLSGYVVDVVHSIDGAARALSRAVPDLVVAGPFRNASGLDFLLHKLQELAVQAVVISDDTDTLHLAQDLGVPVRSPELVGWLGNG